MTADTLPLLSTDEWNLLERGVAMWGGSAQLSTAAVAVVGLDPEGDPYDQLDTLHQSIRDRNLRTAEAWNCALARTELAFSSTASGGALDWEIVTAIDDCESIRLLRSIQRKIQKSPGVPFWG